MSITEVAVSRYQEQGYLLNHEQVFSPEQFAELCGIFEQHLAEKGKKLSDELDTPHFRDERLLRFLLSDNVLDLVEPLVVSIFQQTLPEPIALHWHEFYELCYVVAGVGTHTLNGTAIQLQPGSVFLLTPADVHALRPETTQPLHVFNVIFAETLLTEDTRHLLFDNIARHYVVVPETMRSCLEADFVRMQRKLTDQYIGAQQAVQSTLTRILIDFVRVVRALPTPTRSTPVVRHQALQRALVYMHHHFRQPLTLEAVAHVAHLSPTYLSERFHEYVGVTFQAYLQRLWIEFARSIVILTTQPITEIAYTAGFVTLSHFERVFKQHYHMSPRQYRQLNGTTPTHMEQV